ncbi:glutathione S-transferase [Tateyamaria omphalii]|uniref:glutathione S-transferase family protein n=1 Tax=Tateyamaria omphalii TaxID=299262 RepID=UPI0016755602|nr:glutathione S-transferase N-terminal domain-containing protein [Tateyamaria omphalii]GGX51925.1 glutathione S-transferase [Tateyamaria omphalii]
MTLIIHGRASSSNVQAVMWGAAELGLAVERKDVGGRFGGTDTPAFRRMNPMGLVPVLEDGDRVMFESAAILRYLVTQYGEGGVVASPRDDMWAEWAKHTLCRSFTVPLFWAYYRTPEAVRDLAAVGHALRQFEANLAVAMSERGARAWMSGETLGLADIWVGHILYRYFTLDLDRRVPAGTQDYYDALTERAAYRTHVMVDYSELKGRLSF